jgi:hypothetical protein
LSLFAKWIMFTSVLYYDLPSSAASVSSSICTTSVATKVKGQSQYICLGGWDNRHSTMNDFFPVQNNAILWFNYSPTTLLTHRRRRRRHHRMPMHHFFGIRKESNTSSLRGYAVQHEKWCSNIIIFFSHRREQDDKPKKIRHHDNNTYTALNIILSSLLFFKNVPSVSTVSWHGYTYGFYYFIFEVVATFQFLQQ